LLPRMPYTRGMSWAARRRAYYLGGTFGVFALLFLLVLFFALRTTPTCFDGRHNGDERGVDCGGTCRKVCEADALAPQVLWSRSFRVAPGVYNAVAYVENPNFSAGVKSVPYRFTLYDSSNVTIAEREGRTYLLPGGITPIFEGTIATGERSPARTLFELGDIAEWVVTRDRATSPLSVADRRISRIDTMPRIDANIENSSVVDIFDIEVVSVIYDANDNAIGASRTVVPLLPRQSSEPVVFTWPEPFAVAIERCLAPVDVVLAIDTSGSMNDDAPDPPQPLTDAKKAADDFISRLSSGDRVGVVSFATDARVLKELVSGHALARAAVSELSILPEEETGFTNMGAALREAYTLLRDEGTAGPERDTIVLLTDGLANTPLDPGGEAYAEEEAKRVKEAGIELYTIGLGSLVNMGFLRTLASAPANYFQAASRSDLLGIYRTISAGLCEKGPAIIDVIPKAKSVFFDE